MLEERSTQPSFSFSSAALFAEPLPTTLIYIDVNMHKVICLRLCVSCFDILKGRCLSGSFSYQPTLLDISNLLSSATNKMTVRTIRSRAVHKRRQFILWNLYLTVTEAFAGHSTDQTKGGVSCRRHVNKIFLRRLCYRGLSVIN